MPFAEIDGVRLHYEVAGEGDPLLLISGLSSPAANWAFQVKGLSQHFRVITFDNRGVGESDLPPDPVYSISRMAADAAALLRHLRVRRAHVLGASMGGAIAQELALRQGRLVRSLTLACTWCEADARFLHAIASWMALAHRVDVEERLRWVLYPWVYSPAFFAKAGSVDATLQRALAYPHQTRPEAIERQGKGLLAWNGTRVARLRSLRVPTQVLVGRDDILTPPAFSRALARTIPGARLGILAGGHGFFIEQADAFNAAVLRFLRSVRAK